jgi:two-component system response regulator LytT
MINIAIIEDEAADQAKLREYFLKLSQEKNTLFNLSFFASAEEFLFSFKSGLLDLILMDIELPGINGIEASVQLRKIDSEVALVFMTNLAQYAIEGYKVKAMDYVVKPISYWDFQSRLSNALEHLEEKKKTKVLIVGNDKRVVVSQSSIYYIEVQDHLLVYHTKEGDFKTYGALKPLAGELQASGFSLCNSCFLVNLSYVERVESFTVRVHGTDLLISHPKRKAFLNELNKYLGNA